MSKLTDIDTYISMSCFWRSWTDTICRSWRSGWTSSSSIFWTKYKVQAMLKLNSWKWNWFVKISNRKWSSWW